MIKQTWVVNEEEKRRILSLHENATKRQYLMKEQQIDAYNNQNIISAGDSNNKFYYYVFQPLRSTSVQAIDWNSFYSVVAYDGENAYITQVTEKNSEGIPTKFNVELDKPIPIWDPIELENNEFKFSLIKTEKYDFEWNYDYNEKTKNSLLYKDKNSRYYAVFYRGDLMIAPVEVEKGEGGWSFPYNRKEGIIDFKPIKINSEIEFVPNYHVVSNRYMYRGLTVASTFGFYPMPEGKDIPPPITIPTPPPPPSNLGNSFADNISYPSENIKNNPNYQAIVKFVKGNKDLSNYIFKIQSSASKCNAGLIENQGQVKWKADKNTYPGVKVDPDADMTDIGNLNLTKARAQHLKDFLIQNLPELKNANFEVVAQGSKGVCGTEEENAKNRVVSLTITKVK